MKKIKFLFQQAMTISTGIFFCIGLEGVCFHFMGDDISLEWYHPISIILAGILCALPSLIWLQEEHLNRRQFIVRLVLHCIFLFAVVSLMGYLFHWYTDIIGYSFVVAAYFIVYVFVWGVSYWLGARDESKINEALKDIQDEE